MSLALAGQFTIKFAGRHHDECGVATYRNRPLEVADKGAGMTPAILEKATTPRLLYKRRQV
ncbi:hypothetical protein AU467_20305 [Mesorhizobium loti]|uniref:Uncharacterized protein n=1 Tax=Rhizobium loti TaxID=381 RepID=A0A117N3J1_RHILI|nr:hypothetical protein AU467_20305 [Mesorhizobium loti]